MHFRVTYAFKDGSGSGWSENFYVDADTQDAAHHVATRDMLVNARLGMLSPDYTLNLIRTCNVDSIRDSKVKAFPSNVGNGKFDIGQDFATDASEEPYDRLLVRMDAGTTHRRQLYLGGLPSNQVSRTREYNPTAGFGDAFKKWADLIKVNGSPFKIQFPTYAPEGQADASTVDLGAHSLSFTFQAGKPPGWVKGAKFRVRRSSGAVNVDGIWTIDFASPTTVYTKPKAKKIGGALVNNPFLSLITYDYASITDVQALRGTHRDTGRPFDQSRGRARVRRS